MSGTRPRPILSTDTVEIHRFEEFRFPMLPVTEMFVGTDAVRDDIAALGPDDYDPATDRVVMSSSGYLVSVDGMHIVVDTGVGNGKPRRRDIWDRLDTDWLDRLGAVVGPEDVDVVVSTHLHCDHVGWSTSLDDSGTWVPTFPRARYLYNDLDRRFIESADAEGMIVRNGDFRADSITPIFDYGRAETVDLPYAVGAGVRLEHAPGDTPGHMIVRVHDPASGEPLALITGDALHHVLQVAHPGLTSSFCSMSAEAESTRRRVLGECADTGIPMLAGHVASHDLLYIARTADGFAVDGSRSLIP